MATNGEPVLSSADMPPLFRDADNLSVHGQRRFIRATASRLTLAVAAAVFAAVAYAVHIGEIEVFSIAGAAAFVGAFSVEIWLLTDRPEQMWYQGRALAESAKTLAWRYAVGALPFPLNKANADVYLGEQLAGLLNDAPGVNIVPNSVPVISDSVAALRRKSLTQRREVYIRDRIVDQQRWYGAKAEKNSRDARLWQVGLMIAELIGALIASLKAFDILHADITSIASTALGAGAAWLAVRQHESLGHAYTMASHELGLIAARLAGVGDEDAWAAEVADAEEAISREHTMWRAARAVHEPVHQTAQHR